LEVIYYLAKLNQVENPEYIAENVPGKYQFLLPQPAPDDPPWNSWTAVGLWIFSVLLILILPSFLLIGYSSSLDQPIRESAALIEFAKNDPTAILIQIIAIIPAHLLTIFVAWLVVTRNRTFSFRRSLGWESGGVRWWHYVTILIGFMLTASVVAGYFPEKDNDLMRILQSSRTVAYLVAFLATFTAPLVEEVVYRGVLYSAFQRTFSVPAAFLLVTALFALVHVPQYYPSYSTIFLLALLSVTLTAVRVRSKNLLPCIILHTLFNGLQSIFILLGGSSGPHDPVGFAASLIK
jgi:uncharacterized protein